MLPRNSVDIPVFRPIAILKPIDSDCAQGNSGPSRLYVVAFRRWILRGVSSRRRLVSLSGYD